LAVPKRKTSRARTHSRRSANRKLAPTAQSLCPNCGASKLPHTVCPTCGWYRGRMVIDTE
jgi:large subunit ribosomal protein L32